MEFVGGALVALVVGVEEALDGFGAVVHAEGGGEPGGGEGAVRLAGVGGEEGGEGGCGGEGGEVGEEEEGG